MTDTNGSGVALGEVGIPKIDKPKPQCRFIPCVADGTAKKFDFKKYREEHKAEIKQRMDVYRNNNREKINEKSKVYYEKNREFINEKRRLKYAKDKPQSRSKVLTSSLIIPSVADGTANKLI
jgi:hypothetical protein